ncbi:glutamate synthase-related protein [Halarsenatibacter silvermanii]|uniref:glutamate synthase (NADPH) n=1 Tax=Halarsenatibacter silvermanii TaxID=321763 RepID=A0A1G9R0E6_9FIRM|nr:glutamate synthase-related protein [Halarsenatibacter silvermanii]SDM16673.1 Glutamate synthase domain-containing protein 2 [Halarsenatibacter silvermanii]
MKKNMTGGNFQVMRDDDKCVNCRICEKQCSYDVHSYDEDKETMEAENDGCVNCQRCTSFCPQDALHIEEKNQTFPDNQNWSDEKIRSIYRQAETGGILLSGMGNPESGKIYWDHMLLNASQVTNPSIDPLREPMEVKTFLGRKPDSFSDKDEEIPPQLEIDTPILFAGMSFGALSLNACRSIARAASELNTIYNTGEGGLHEDLYRFQDNTMVQVASGRFGVHRDYLQAGRAIEIKIGQGAKPGIGGHLPGEKVKEDISQTRMIPEGTDALSPAPHHDIYSIEDLRQLIYSLKEATDYEKPVAVKVSAVHNVASIAVGIATAGADIIAIDGYRGGTGAAPTRIRNNVGIPIEFALAAVDDRLREENLRNNVSLIAGGSIRSSADVVKAIALGADAVYIGTAAMIALGCHMCRQCFTGSCPWGIATQDPDLVGRLDPEEGAERVKNLITGWTHEIKEMMGGMGINAIESLRGNRLMLRGVDLTREELDILGIHHAGR